MLKQRSQIKGRALMGMGPLFYVWCIGAVIMGAVFAFMPDRMVEQYKRHVDSFRLPERVAKWQAPRPWTRTFYRFAGMLFMIMGIVFAALAFAGVIRP